MYGGSEIASVQSHHIPAVGDVFWWETNGPFKVVERAWHFPEGFNSERSQLVSLDVERIKPHA